LAEKLGMTLFEMRKKMPVSEMLAWITYFNESTEEKDEGLDLSSASPEQLMGLFK
jgi:hypothetical protein